MTIEVAVRWTEILVGFAFVLQSLEHIFRSQDARSLFLIRAILSVLLLVGFETPLITLLLMMVALLLLKKFDGPYNGGADRMGLLILICLVAVNFLPTNNGKELAFGYLAIQLTLSYFISGWVKIVNPAWRSGRALSDVFLFSVYPVSEQLRSWSTSYRSLFIMSWTVIVFELMFPFTLVSTTSLIVALVIAGMFHLANACLFGLNRFFWIWIAAFPSILWFQQRIFVTIIQ